MFSPNRRPLRRRGLAPTRLRAEMLETRLTPAVTYGMPIGRMFVSNGGTGTIVGHNGDHTPPSIAFDSTTSGLAGTTVNDNQDLTGRVTDDHPFGVTMTVSVDGGAATNVPVDTQGFFDYTSTLATDGTADGAHTFKFVAKDAAGNVSSAKSLSFTLQAHDTTAPTLAFDSATSALNNTTVADNKTLTGTITDNHMTGLTLTVSVDGGTAQNVTVGANGAFSFTTALANDGTANGSHTFSFTAKDAAGNTSAAQTITINLQAQNPNAPTVAFDQSTSALDSTTVTGNQTLTGTVTGPNMTGVTLTVSVDGQTPQNVQVASDGTFSYTTTLASDGSADGAHTFSFVAKDANGLASAAKSLTVTLHASPAVTLDAQTSALNSITVNGNKTLSGTVTAGDMTGLTLTVSVDGQAPQNVTIGAGGTFSYTTTLATDGSADGTHTFSFVAKNSAGVASPAASVTFKLNAEAGDLTVQLDPASDTGTAGDNKTTNATVNLVGQGPANSTITLHGSGATTTSDSNGTYRFTNLTLVSGSNTFTVSATSASNQQLTATVTVIRDDAPSVASAVGNFSVAENATKSLFNLPTIFSDQDVNTLLQFTTNRGTFDVELFDQQMPITVANYLKYVTGTDAAGTSLANTIFHRETNLSTDGIGVLQGGGFRPGSSTHVADDAAITLEANFLTNYLSNALGTIAMARTDQANSATSEFFFNTTANTVLDPNGSPDSSQTGSGDGYTVFGVVRGDGMSVVDASAAVPPVNEGGAFGSIPLTGIAPNDPNFPGDATAANYELIQSVSVLRQPNAQAPDSLTFTVSDNTNPNLVKATITGGLLSLAYTTGQTGSATITLTATDSAGATAETTFTVTVGGTNAPTVVLTGPADGLVTSTNPHITGTATVTANGTTLAHVTAAVDGGAAQQLAFDAGGHFTFTPSVPTNGSGDGRHTVVFTATDGLGNVSASVTYSFRIDTRAPTVTITSPASGQSFTSDPTIKGTATDDNTVSSLTATVDNGSPQPVSVDSLGHFSFVPSLATDGSANGSHTVKFQATDSAGNVSSGTTITFTLNVVSAAVTLDPTPADGAASKSDPTFTGTFSANAPAGSLRVAVDNGTPTALTVNAQGHFTFTPSLPTDGTADGHHTVTFTAAGTTLAAVSRSFIIDTTAPAVSVTSPTNGQSFDTNPTLTGTATDASTSVATFTASVDGGTAQTVTVDSQGHFSFTTGLATDGTADGLHSVVFSATDAVGNVTQSAATTFRLDTTGPSLTIITPSDGISATTSPAFTGTITDTNTVASLTVSVDGGAAQPVTVDAQGNFSFDPHFAVDGTADGFHTFTFVGQDAAGNQTTVTRHYTLDTTKPVVMIQSPQDGGTFNTNPTITVSATDNIGTGFATAQVDGGTVFSIPFAAGSPFTFTTQFNLDGSDNGSHTVTFIAFDAAGNQSDPVTFHFTLHAP
jgi:cyclophilin family peptidyl-prolyl cis-trans isomerase